MTRKALSHTGSIVIALALISLAGIGCSNSAAPTAPADSSPLLTPIVDNRNPEPKYDVVYTGTVERVDFDARVIYLLKTDFDVVVPLGAESYLVPSKRLVPFTNKYFYEGAKVTVKGYYKGTDIVVAEALEVADEVTTGQTWSNSL